MTTQKCVFMLQEFGRGGNLATQLEEQRKANTARKFLNDYVIETTLNTAACVR